MFASKTPDSLRGAIFGDPKAHRDPQDRQAVALEVIAECPIQLVEIAKAGKRL